MPRIKFHSTMLRPDSVNRVRPPNTTIPNTKHPENMYQYPTIGLVTFSRSCGLVLPAKLAVVELMLVVLLPTTGCDAIGIAALDFRAPAKDLQSANGGKCDAVNRLKLHLSEADSFSELKALMIEELDDRLKLKLDQATRRHKLVPILGRIIIYTQ